jgi:hypothetical protein
MLIVYGYILQEQTRMFKLLSRKHLSATGLLNVVHSQFKKIKPPRELAKRSKLITLTDCLMSGVAMFGLKFPSLLKFDEAKEEAELKHNLRTLYHVKQAPSDTYMRERCDEVDPFQVRKVFKAVFSCVQRGKGLKTFEYIDQHYLLAGDGTGFFSSDVVHCKNCCVKHYNQSHVKIQGYVPEDASQYKKNTYIFVGNSKQPWELYCIDHTRQIIKFDPYIVDGLQAILMNKSRSSLSKEDTEQIKKLVTEHYQKNHPAEEDLSYYHNMFCAAIVHPDHKIVLPLAPEPIMKADGATKNDCERNSAKRLYADARREHPHMKFIVVEDSLASNVPHLSDLKRLDMRYIVGVKPGDHKFLFEFIKTAACIEYTHKTKDGTIHRYRYINQVQLNKSHDFKTNFIEYWEENKKGGKQHFCWVTDITITNDNAYQIMRGGRINWRIENNTFNTLKNQDYHFSHNFGHGNENLCSVFGMLMMLAFFIDQVQELCCQLFKAARAKFKSRTSLWEKCATCLRNT